METHSFRLKLSQRIGMDDVNETLRLTHDSDKRKQELYDLVVSSDESVGYYAAWICTHFSSQDNKWLYNKHNELIDEVLVCKHAGKRRLILNLLYKQPLANPPRVDFLNFTLDRMVSKQELPGVQTLCMKLAYEMCRTIPELLQEFRIMLDIMEPSLLSSVAVHTVRKNILKAMKAGRSLC